LNREFNVTRNTPRLKVGGEVLVVSSQLPAPTPAAAVVASVASVAGDIEVVHVVVIPEDPADPMLANVEIPAGSIVVNDMEEFVEDDIDHQMESELRVSLWRLLSMELQVHKPDSSVPSRVDAVLVGQHRQVHCLIRRKRQPLYTTIRTRLTRTAKLPKTPSFLANALHSAV
jgi:hypothetical protein